MGKSRKKLAVLLAAAMTASMMFGGTVFAAEPVPQDAATDVSAADAGTADAAAVNTEQTVIPAQPAETDPASAAPAAITPENTTGDNEIINTADNSLSGEEQTSLPDSTEENLTADPQTGTEENTAADPQAGAEENLTADPQAGAEENLTADPQTGTEENLTADPQTGAEENLTADPQTGTEENTAADPQAGAQENIGAGDEPSVSESYVSIAGSDNLTVSDSFVSLGEGKGSYKYTNDTLVLKDVVIEVEDMFTPGIDVAGDLVVILEGDNSIIVCQFSEGISVWTGNLTIKGDGTLSISNKGGVYAEDGVYYEGIYVPGGEVTIDGADVTIDVITNDQYSDNSGIFADEISIINGANVDITNTSKGTMTFHNGIYATSGRITIKDSNVNVTADGVISSDGSILQAGTGLLSTDYSFDPEYAGRSGIVIENSNVRSIGSLASMLVYGLDGTIRIDGSTVVTPDGASIRDLMQTIDLNDPDAAPVLMGAILAYGEGAVDLDEIFDKLNSLEYASPEWNAYLASLLDSVVHDTTIVRNSELKTESAGVALTSSSTPKTGDSFNAEMLCLALIAAGSISAYLIRRRIAA